MREHGPLYGLSATVAFERKPDAAGVAGQANDGPESQVIRTLQDIPVLFINLMPAGSPSQVPLRDASQRVVRADPVKRFAGLAVEVPRCVGVACESSRRVIALIEC